MSIIRVKKERLMGMEVTFARTPLQALRALFDIAEPEEFGETVLHGTPEYRKYIIKHKALNVKWGAVQTGKQREAAGLRRIQEQYRSLGGEW